MAAIVALPTVRPCSRRAFLACAFRKREVVVQHVLDAEEHVAEPGAAHQRSQGRAVLGDGCGHRLHAVLQVVEVVIDDRAAERLEPPDVERDVVVHQEDGARAVVARVADVGQHAVHGVRVEVAAAHLDDRAEAAVERAAARRFDDVDLASEERVALEHARAAVGQANRVGGQAENGARRVADPGPGRPVRQAGDPAKILAPFEFPQQLAERVLPLAAHDELDVLAPFVRVRREAGVVPADDDPRPRQAGAHELHEAQRGAALERHHREPDDVRPELLEEPFDRGPDARLHEDEVCDGHAVVRVHVAGERGERAARHPHREGGHVLEGVRHREQEHVHVRRVNHFEDSAIEGISIPAVRHRQLGRRPSQQ